MSGRVEVNTIENINVQGQAVKYVFATAKRQPISLVCGQCNTRCPTEVNEVRPGCCAPPFHIHNCSNCGAHLATVVNTPAAKSCNIF